MSKIYIIDLVNDVEGHYFMMEALSKIQDTIEVDTHEKKILLKKHPISGFLERIKMYRRCLSKIPKSKEDKIAHFLTGDKFYMLPFLYGKKSRNLKFVMTLHRFPKSRVLQLLLKNFATQLSRIIVYSDYLKECCNKIGISNVEVIPYASFYDYSNIRSKLELKRFYGVENKYVFTSLGGTRIEKGLDILLNSFRHIDQESKQQIVLNVAGQELEIKKDEILRLSKKYGINVLLNLKILSDIEFCENVNISDVMVLPYRCSFNSGASGPMTEAMSRGIPCIFPAIGSLSYYKKYEAGETFEIENPKSLGRAIMEIIPKLSTSKYGGKQGLFLEYNYTNQHHILYKEILNESC